MIRTGKWVGLAVSLLAFLSAANARADEWNKKSVLTFSQPFEVPGRVLPAGTYTFKLADMMNDRHIVQIFNADGSQLIVTLMTVPDFRLKTTTDNVVRFNEVPRGSPEAIRAWFYPGNSIGQEFVYPRARAEQLAKATKTVVPAIVVADIADVNVLRKAPIVAITPDAQEVPVRAAIETAPVPTVADNNGQQRERAPTVGPTGQSARNEQGARTTLPQTASMLPMIVSFGALSIAVGTLLMLFRKSSPASAPQKP